TRLSTPPPSGHFPIKQILQKERYTYDSGLFQREETLNSISIVSARIYRYKYSISYGKIKSII
ncbi:MAG: hypothetical protein QGH25_24455, partial [Candidatus Latescibacteria bacterium]|nr:hypothetical protein [Candidatus Latescibacterota bacterium]